MIRSIQPLQFLLTLLAGWINRWGQVARMNRD
jgi:hypothetical protein